MTTELEKQKMERIYKHFGFTGENIQSQKQVREDTYKILKNLGLTCIISPSNVSISTKNSVHSIINYWFDVQKNGKVYREAISFDIKKDYKYEELEDIVKHQVQAIFKESEQE